MSRPKSKPFLQDFFDHFDRLPEKERNLGALKNVFVSVASSYGFEKIQPAVLEEVRQFAPLFKAGVFKGRQPLIFKAAGGADVFLNPSVALSIIRSYVSQKMNDLPHPLKFIFDGDSVFLDSARAQGLAGIPEWGLIMVGEEGPIAEAEIILALWRGAQKMGIGGDGFELKINAAGCNVCRSAFRSAFSSHLRSRIGRFCKNCKRLVKKSPFKTVLCEDEKCRTVSANVPQILDFLCDLCKKQLRGVLEFLEDIRIPYFLDSKLLKEGSWYGTVFFQFAVSGTTDSGDDEKGPSVKKFVFAEGGRMSRAGELLAGKRIDIVSATLLMDKTMDILRHRGFIFPLPVPPRVFVVQLGELAKRKSLLLLEHLREGGISFRESLGRDSIKSQLRVAEKSGAEIALILGQKEALDETIIVREIGSGIQETVPQTKLLELLRRKLREMI